MPGRHEAQIPSSPSTPGPKARGDASESHSKVAPLVPSPPFSPPNYHKGGCHSSSFFPHQKRGRTYEKPYRCGDLQGSLRSPPPPPIDPFQRDLVAWIARCWVSRLGTLSGRRSLVAPKAAGLYASKSTKTSRWAFSSWPRERKKKKPPPLVGFLWFGLVKWGGVPFSLYKRRGKNPQATDPNLNPTVVPLWCQAPGYPRLVSLGKPQKPTTSGGCPMLRQTHAEKTDAACVWLHWNGCTHGSLSC